MRVLHVVCEYPSKNRPFANIFIKVQVDSLKEQGIEIDVYDIKSHESILNYFSSVPQLKKKIEYGNYDLIHAHYSYAGLTAFLASPQRPVLLSLMGSDLLGVKDQNGKMKLRGRFDVGLSNFVAQKVSHVIVKSQEMKDKLKTTVPASVIPNGINTSLFFPTDSKVARKELNINEDDFVILFLGNPQKIVKNYNLAQKSVDLFSKKKVRFLNPFGIPIEKVVKYMNAANVLLLTSFYEGSPNVIKEAMACNLPIISTNVGDAKDVLKNTKNCFIVKSTVNAFIEKLSIIYTNRERSDGVQRIQHLKNEVIASKIINLYKKLQT